MPVLNKPRWENYARNLAKGMVQIEAYEQAGFKPHSGAASQMANHPVIMERVEEIKREREAILSGPSVYDEDEENGHGDPLVVVNEQWVIQKLAANVVSAMSVGNHSAANKALEMLGQNLGMSFADMKAKAAEGSATPGLGQGNTFNFMAVSDLLTQHAARIEQKGMKDVTPASPPGDDE